MGLVTRGGRAFLYHSTRVDGRVRTAYLGYGPEAEALADELARLAASCRASRERARANRAAAEADSRRLDGLVAGARGLAHRALEAAGYHRPGRGEWRRRRGGPAVGEIAKVGGGPPAGRPDDHAAAAAEVEGFVSTYLGAAMRGDASALPKVRHYFGTAERLGPATLEVAVKAHGGDPAEAALEAAIRRYAGGDLVRAEAARRGLAAFRAGLEGPGPVPPLERILVHRASSCWLAVHDLEARATRLLGAADARAAEPYDRLAGRAHRRLLEVLRLLDQVRRKVPPGVQVNVVAGNAALLLGRGPAEGPDGPPGLGP